MKRIGLALVATVAWVGCGGGTSVSGTVKGTGFAAQEAISTVWTQHASGITTTSGAILISTAASVCGTIGGGHAPAGAQTLLLTLTDVDGKTGAITAPTGSATYTVVTNANGELPAHVAGVAYVALDGQCDKAVQAIGASGTVTLTGASTDGHYTGSFDLVLDSGDRLTGHFDSNACAALGTQLDQMGELPCG